MATAGDIVVNLVANPNRMNRGLSDAQRGMQRFTAGINVSVGRVVGRLAAIGAAAMGVRSAIQSMNESVALAADAEKTQTAFRVMLKDAEKASKLMKQLEDFAASTPFQLPELQAATRSLLAFGFGASEVQGELRKLGDIAAGLNIPIGDLAEIYGKARVQGRLFAEDINQLTGRGIPIIGKLAQQFGIAENEVKKLVESGKVGFPEIQQAFTELTSGAGMFAGGMQALSQTAAGKLSTLRDNVDSLKRSFGNELLPVLADVTDNMTTMVKESSGLKSGVLGLAGAFDVLARSAMGTVNVLGQARTGWIRLGDAIGVALAGGDIGEDTLRRNEILNIAAGDKRKAIPRPAAKAPDAADAVKQRNAADEALLDRLDADRDFMDRIFKSGPSRVVPNDGGGITAVPAGPPGEDAFQPLANVIEQRLAGALSTQSSEAASMIARAGLGARKDPQVEIAKTNKEMAGGVSQLVDLFRRHFDGGGNEIGVVDAF